MSEDNPLNESILPLLGIPFEAEGIPFSQPIPLSESIVYPYNDLDAHVFRSIARQAGTLQKFPQGVDFSLSKQEIVMRAKEKAMAMGHPPEITDGSNLVKEQWDSLWNLYQKEFPDLSAKRLQKLSEGEILPLFKLPLFKNENPHYKPFPFLLSSPKNCPEWLADKSDYSWRDNSCRRGFVSTIIRTESLRDCGFFIFGHFFNMFVKPNFLDVSLTKTLLLSPSYLLVFNLS